MFSAINKYAFLKSKYANSFYLKISTLVFHNPLTQLKEVAGNRIDYIQLMMKLRKQCTY